MNAPKRTAIIGASGSIGGALLTGCRQARWPVVGTGFNNLAEGMLQFDLRRDAAADLLPGLGPGDVVYLLSAMTSPNRVAARPALAREINLTASCRLAEEVLAAGARLIAVSSTQVFDGRSGGYDETSPCSPLTLYGRLKREFEEFLAAQNGDWTVIRTDAVIDPHLAGNCPVEKTYQTLWGGAARMAEDNLLNLTAMEDLCRVLMRLAAPAASRLYHVAAQPAVSRAQLAQWIRERSRFGARMDFSVVGFDELSFPEPRPRATWLDGTRLTRELGMQPVAPETPVAEKVEKIDQAVSERGPWWLTQNGDAL